jgi:hypothetical protein
MLRQIQPDDEWIMDTANFNRINLLLRKEDAVELASALATVISNSASTSYYSGGIELLRNRCDLYLRINSLVEDMSDAA